MVLPDREYVVLNIDETSVSTMDASTLGLVAMSRIKRAQGWTRPKQSKDRSDTKTTYVGVISDSPMLQPHLPQVLLPRYTKSKEPPIWLRTSCQATGRPFEYWYNSGGWISSPSMRRWITRLRSTVSSWNPNAWIILVMDCARQHLDVTVIRHLRALGIIPIIIPAKLTWLLQPLDVYVFGELKAVMRANQTSLHMATPDGRAAMGAWVRMNAHSIRQVVVQRSWRGAFAKLGYGPPGSVVHCNLQKYMPQEEVTAALPTLAEFAELLHLVPHTDTTNKLHNLIVGSLIDDGRQGCRCTAPGRRVEGIASGPRRNRATAAKA